MHQPVLDSHLEQSSQGEAVAGRGITSQISSRQLFVQRGTGSSHIVVHIAQGRPIRGYVGRQASIDRVNAKGEEPVQFGLRTVQSEDAIPEQIPIERFEVPDIKDDAVALWNRPLVEEVATNDVEKRVTLTASMEQAVG
jgi:hypothetical protein